MIRLLLSPEQFAAMQLCGSILPCMSKSLKYKGKEIEDPLKITKEDDIILRQISKEQYQPQRKGSCETNQKRSHTIFTLEMDDRKKFMSNPNMNPDTEDKELFKKESMPLITFTNHLEKIDLIERDQNVLSQYLNRFIQNQKCSQSEVNLRILGCMVGLDQDQLAIQSLQKI